MGRARLGLCPTQTRPNLIEWGRFQPAIDPNEVSNQPGWVVSVFKCESVDFGFFDIAEFWLKSGQT